MVHSYDYDNSEDSCEEVHTDTHADSKIDKPFVGFNDNITWKEDRDFCGTGFVNSDGRSCSVSAVLSLLQHIKPFMEMIEAQRGPVCQILHEIYQLRGSRDKRIAKIINKFRSLLGLAEYDILDPNELLQKLLTTIIQNEGCPKEIFCGVRKARVTPNSSFSEEVILETMNATEDDLAVQDIGMPSSQLSTPADLREFLCHKLNDSITIPHDQWTAEWTTKYSEQSAQVKHPEVYSLYASGSLTDDNIECKKRIFWETAPEVAILTLQRAKPLGDKKDNRHVSIPWEIPQMDFKKPEDEGLHSILDSSSENPNLTLFGMVVHSDVRDHCYTIIRASQLSNRWIVYDDLKTYEVEMTDDLLKHLGGGERKDSSITFIYVNSWESSVKKLPSPDLSKQKDILRSLGTSTDEECIIIDDHTPVDYQRIFHTIENKTKEFVGLQPLKKQFLRFAKTAILNEKRKSLGYEVDDMNSAMHFIFQGNPGTGKTTFARKVADLLHSIKKKKKKSGGSAKRRSCRAVSWRYRAKDKTEDKRGEGWCPLCR